MINYPPLSKAHLPSKDQNYETLNQQSQRLCIREMKCNPWIMSVFACTSWQQCACVISNAFTFDIYLFLLINIISKDLQLMYINFGLSDFFECHKRPKRPTFTIFPERDAAVVWVRHGPLKLYLPRRRRSRLERLRKVRCSNPIHDRPKSLKHVMTASLPNIRC